MRYLWIAVPLVLLVCIAVVAVVVFTMKKRGLAGQSSLGNPTPIPSETSTLPPTPTSAPNFRVKTGLTGISLLTGPGESYPEATFIYDDVTVIGQVDGCAWYKVVSVTNPSIYGWVSADKLNYPGNCSDVNLVDIPPTALPSATFTLIPSATFTLVPTSKPSSPGQPANTCKAQSAMTLGNRTGAYADFQLVGPGTFYVSLPPDVNTTFPVCEGCYDVYILNGNNGCGYAEGEFMGRICDGFNGWLQCG